MTAYSLHDPESLTSCAVFSSPHSGRSYSDAFLESSRLNSHQLRCSEDAFVEELFCSVPDAGAPLIAAIVPRAYLDLNRGPGEIDPALVIGAPTQGLNPRVAAGLGVVPRVVAEGVPIYTQKLKMQEVTDRIGRFHTPYHSRLDALITRARRQFGIAVLFDCHSMPSDALRSIVRNGGTRPDIVLGDRYGASAAPWLMDRAQAVFEAAGFQVARNTPFAGGYITQRYGRPSRRIHAIQIEIDRGLYLHEAKVEMGAGFEETQMRLTKVIEGLSRIALDEARLAAE